MMHADPQDNSPLAFFKAHKRAFAATLADSRSRPDLVQDLLTQAFSSFEANVRIQSEGQPAVACHKGCATCCTIRVTATAPEILLVARYVRVAAEPLKQADVDLVQRLADADAATRGLSEQQRVALRRRCPFIVKGVCVIYAVRPLACRGHASHDKHACIDAAAGRTQSVPHSGPHMMVRSLVQNAMQSALRDAGYAWTAYELNHGLLIALENAGSAQAWAAGEDVFGPAQVSEVSLEEMEQTFDRIDALQ